MNRFQKVLARLFGIKQLTYQEFASYFRDWVGMPPAEITSGDIAYRHISWVYACIKRICDSATSVPLRIYKWSKEGAQEIFDGPAAILSKPLFQDRRTLLKQTFGWYELKGEVYWWMPRSRGGKGPPLQIMLIPSTVMIPEPGTKRPVEYYTYLSQEGPKRLEPEEVFVIRMFDPLSGLHGVAPIEAAMVAADVNYKSLYYGKRIFTQSARPGGIIRTDQELDIDTVKRLADEWNAEHQGAEGAYRTGWLSHGFSWQDTGLSPQEIQFMETRKMTREEICAVFGVPPLLVGITEKVPYASAMIELLIFWECTMKPLLADFTDALNEQFLSLFDGDYYAEFDLSSVEAYKDMARKQAEINIKYLDRGVLLPNEVRRELNLPDTDFGWTYRGSAMNIEIGTYKPPEEVSRQTEIERKAAQVEMIKTLFTLTKENKKLPQANRVQLWKLFDANLKPQEERLQKEIIKLFRKQGKEVANRVEELKIRKNGEKQELPEGWMEEIFDMAKWKEAFERMERPFVVAFLRQAAEEEIARFGLGIAFDMSNPRIAEFIKERTQQFAAVNETTSQEIRALIASRIEEGASTYDVAKELRGYFDVRGKTRAWTIARTEVPSANNFGNHEAMLQSPMVEFHEWLATMDDKVRDTHAALDGYRCPKAEPYPNGLMYPGDPVGDPEEIINCRCTELPITGEI